MFSWGKKSRAAEAISRGTRSILTGAYFHHSEVEGFGLNDSASAWLLTEGYAHQFYALGYISATALQAEKWATQDFFMESALAGMKEAESDGGPDVVQLAPVLINRYTDFDGLSGQQRLANEHYSNSAMLVRERDQSADIEAITAALKDSTENYIQDARKMFGV